MLSVEHNGRILSAETTAELVAMGAPQASVDAEVASKRAKDECRRRIYQVASAESQMNMATAAAVISGKAVSARTDNEKAILAGAEAALSWVAAMRNAVAGFASDPELDVLSDSNWPVVPAAVTAIVSQF